MNYYKKILIARDKLRAMYPEGTRVEWLNMEDPYSPVPPGTRGTVDHVDDMATIHVDWDNGSGLGLVYGEDSFRKLTQEEVEAEQNSVSVSADENDIGMTM